MHIEKNYKPQMFYKNIHLCVASILSLCLVSGCSYIYEEPASIDDVNHVSDYMVDDVSSEWLALTDGIEIREYSPETYGIIVLKINPDYNTFKVSQDVINPKTVDDWHYSTSSNIVINGGYFKEDYTPAGGIIINEEVSGALTHSGKNGYTGMILIEDGDLELRYLPEDQYEDSEEADYGIQSFPTLILPGGLPGVEKDSGKTGARSLIAKDKDGNILFIKTLSGTITLYETMNFLLDSDLNIDIAINLDGGPSSGLVVYGGEQEYVYDSLSLVPNVISVHSKQ